MSAVQPNLQKQPLGERLIAQGLITERQLHQALDYQRENRLFLGQAIVNMGLLPMSTIGRYLEETSGFPYVDLSRTEIDMEAAQLLPESMARERDALVFAATGKTARVAMIDPLNLTVLDEIRARLDRAVFPYVAFESDLLDAINRVYSNASKTQRVLDDLASAEALEPEPTVDVLIGMAEDAPIVRLVNSLIESAITAGASDLHIEPMEEHLRIRFRIDGLLCEQATIPRQHLAAVDSRVKIMCHMNIAERRRPQDGRIVYSAGSGHKYDLRVSAMPSIFGEKIVMRILAKSSSFATPATLGFFPEQRDMFERFTHYSHGILLVTGPTGSGKSTTLFSALNLINNISRNVTTIEDPVEYNIVGVTHTQVNPQIGVTFASGLRTILRQDPDVIMVGEIRDEETAAMAIQSALTGHLVLSTLHTNNAAGAVTRLMNMEIEPYLISASLICVIGQRLLRTVCQYCQEQRPPDVELLTELGIEPGAMPEMLPVGVGCEKCRGTGVKGRAAAFEMMPLTETIREMLSRGASTEEIHKQSVRDGMMPMREAGIKKVLQGSVPPQEILREFFSEDFQCPAPDKFVSRRDPPKCAA